MAVEIKGPANESGCAGCFLLFRRPSKRSIQAACTPPVSYNFQKSNQNQPSATVQAAFPIPATRAGFPRTHRLSAAKSRDSKNAVR